MFTKDRVSGAQTAPEQSAQSPWHPSPRTSSATAVAYVEPPMPNQAGNPVPGEGVNEHAASVLSHWAEPAPRLAPRDHSLLSNNSFTGTVIPLPHRERLQCELGIDLSGIEAQRGEPGAMDNVGAAAFASGNLVAFSDAQPSYEQAREEVIHVLQQSRGQGRGISSPRSAAEESARLGVNHGAGNDASLHRQEKQVRPKLAPSTAYTLQAEDIDDGVFSDSILWERIARAHGITTAALKDRNPDAQEKAGAVIFIPSAEELAYKECERKAGGDLAEATRLFSELKSSDRIKLLNTARLRASGRLGQSYSNMGVDGVGGKPGVFLSPNSQLAGASPKKSETINGQTEYQVNWNSGDNTDGFWKCSTFMEDVVYQSGYKPAMHGEAGKKHYVPAGQLQENPDTFTEISVELAGPGSLVQIFGGTGSDDSHNAVLSSFVSREESSFFRKAWNPIDAFSDKYKGQWERWTLSIIGAEKEGAGESSRTEIVSIQTGADGKKAYRLVEGHREGGFIRFFKPAKPRGKP